MVKIAGLKSVPVKESSSEVQSSEKKPLAIESKGKSKRSKVSTFSFEGDALFSDHVFIPNK